ncbi:hypothetical protein GCM10027030_18240 [Luteococcus sediminum]|uniref:glycerophosphodiester phosphodiesterase n=1 Tax=Luteococcus sp. TaxID=1969402 RepID=UPI003736711F
MDTRHFTRRQLMAGGLGVGAAALLAGCSAPEDGVTSEYADAFSIAHRGGGRNWPEMTVHAYQQAGKLPGLPAMELSVHRSADGVLVCHHDFSTRRMTGRDLEIVKTPWSQLRTLKVHAKETLDPEQPSRPIARIEEVLEVWPKDMTLWVEPKANEAVDPLFALLSKDPDRRVVWKRPINAPGFQKAKLEGWGTFGYVFDGDRQTRYLDQMVPSKWLDMVGVQVEASDQRITEVVTKAGTYGKETVVWAVNTIAQRDRALKLGCRGLMTSNIVELLDAPMPD